MSLPEAHTSISVRATYVDAICAAVPELSAVLRPAVPQSEPKPIGKRRTEELLGLIDAGLFNAQIARAWGVSYDTLARWIASDAERSARARQARRRQAELWDHVALQVIAHAPSDRIELARAAMLAQHCRWRAEAFNRDRYGRDGEDEEQRPERELTTRELRIIAAGGVVAVEE